MTGRSEPTLASARAAYEAHRWGEARAQFLALRAEGDLAASDMAALAEAAWWEGAIDESLSASEEAYRRYLQGEDPGARGAAMQALDIGFSWFLRGEEAIGSGWLSRAQRLLEDEPECVEQGYLQTLGIEAAIGEGRLDEAIELARAIAALAERYGDETLGAYALVGEGIARTKQGRVADGLRMLDEAMLPVVAGRVRPIFAGNIYCQLMSICHKLSDLRRAEQWTDATTRWCEGFDSAVMFLGVCRVHRAQLLQVRGDWAKAEAEIEAVCEELAAMNVGAVGLALYELGEVRRSRGDLAGAEEAYAEAQQHGRDPQPGLALVRAAQGRFDEALDALRGAEATTLDVLAKTRLWDAMVEVAFEAGDAAAAREACAPLEEAARTFASSGLLAAADLARGRVQLLAEEPGAALEAFTSARQRWQELDAPLRVAQTRALLARAHEALGNAKAADVERAAAGEAHARLGVVPPAPAGKPSLPDGITPREAEVLALVAQGMSNREVAAALVVSEKTVARHLANLYTKLQVSSRTAAAAYAHAHGLVTPPSA